MVSSDRHSLTAEDARENAITLRQQSETLIQSIRQIPGYATFLTLPSFENVQQATKRDRPLVYLTSTAAGSLALIVTQDEIQSIWLDNLSETQLIDLLDDTWFATYSQSQTNRQNWLNAIDSVTYQLWEPLMQPLTHHLKARSYHQATLIPTGYLSLLPLHATWAEDETHPTRRRYALDDIHFTYAPNAKSLTAAESIAKQTRTDSILAIDNPRQDLPNSEREVNAAISNFHKSTVLNVSSTARK